MIKIYFPFLYFKFLLHFPFLIEYSSEANLFYSMTVQLPSVLIIPNLIKFTFFLPAWTLITPSGGKKNKSFSAHG